MASALLPAALLAMLAGCGRAGDVSLTNENQGQVIEVSVGQTLHVRLVSTTGATYSTPVVSAGATALKPYATRGKPAGEADFLANAPGDAEITAQTDIAGVGGAAGTPCPSGRVCHRSGVLETFKVTIHVTG